MKQPKVFAHASYIGTTGYNNHTREFFRHLSKYLDIKVRNYTVGSKWDESSLEEPHNNEPYLTDIDKNILHQQTLLQGGSEQNRFETKIYPNYGQDFNHNVNLILSETNHYYFYEGYNGPKIGYNVWESTVQPKGFFNQWKEFDQLWVPSKWQAECTIKQGADPDRVKVVPEGVDINTFYPEDPQTTLDYVDGRFKFIHFGRWDYRKSTKEIIETFLKEFDPSEPVDLILSIDNPWGEPLDGCKTTQERLEKFNISDPRLKIKHFPSREDYITYMKNGHVFLSCARAEGWNLPLIEAMACGTPSIYSDCSGQTEFARGKGLPVKIIGEKSTQGNNYSNFGINLEDKHIPGNYYEPDYEDLARVMRDAFENYTDHKKRAIEEAKIIHRDFNWDKVAQIGRDTLQDFMVNYTPKPNKILISYIDGPKVEVKGDIEQEYFIEFINSNTNEVIHSTTINNNMWTTCSKNYYIPWIIKVNGKIVNTLNLEKGKVLISLESKSIGDTLAWTPYAVEFAKKHNCKVVLSTFHNDWFKDLEAYKNIEFTPPGSNISGLTASYKIGWFRDNNGGWKNFEAHPNQCNTIPLQQTATDILGLEYKELNLGINFKKQVRPIKNKYIVIGPQATSGCKEWPKAYWISLIKLLTQSGYQVVALTKDQSDLPNVINSWNQPFDKIANYLLHADMFIGLGSGLSWFNWALNKHTVMINGFVEEGHEFTSKVTRLAVKNSCSPCWTNPNFTFDASDWEWCPIWKGTDKQFICQKSITPGKVFTEAKKLLNNKK
jgi:autotransporter strand-loop-strand O-heptosyltransferase